MATLTVLTPDEAGATLAAVTPGGSGDLFENALGKTLFYINNASGSSVNVTFTAQDTTSYNIPGQGKTVKTDRVVTVPAGAIKVIGPFDVKAFNNTSSQVAVLCSATSSVTVAAIKY